MKHDAETDGVHFTIPTKIAPRNGNTSSEASTVAAGDFEITVDVNRTEDITGLQSPSHLIGVTLGSLSTSTDAALSVEKGFVIISQKNCTLEEDFVLLLLVLCKEIGTLKGIAETHSTIPNHRAMLVTLVPKFQLPPSRPELVFLVDRYVPS